jgi:ABC-type nitrate/sulfonate/bicarbonate transport system ATPase subunit
MSADPLTLRAVSHSFGAVEVVRDLSLAVARGEFVAVVGPSGCGKTTLLNLMSGFLAPDSGAIERPGRGRMVFQQDGLFPWLTVEENIGMALRAAPPASREAQVRELLALIRLEEFRGHYPHQLSGGMRQRVELARALAGDTDLLLMDEPFSALDYQTRLRMRGELIRVLELKPRTVVFVTHDIEEAAQLADRVLVLTERPATIRRELRLHSARPRSLTDREVLVAEEEILDLLGLRSPRLEPDTASVR